MNKTKYLFGNISLCCVQSPERKIEKAQWRRTINFWRDIFASVTFCNYYSPFWFNQRKNHFFRNLNTLDFYYVYL